MFTQVKTPQDIFFSPQRLVVPLFQRPYVWSLERQWEPLWLDLRRIADQLLAGAQPEPHFLGAIVLQNQQSEIGNLAVRTVIDGQQRLTTLQILLDAIHGVLEDRGFSDLALQIQNLVRNQDAYINDPSDRFKVWPTNRDRAAFDEVMALTIPNYAKLQNGDSRIAKAHQYFLTTVGGWLEGEDPLALAGALVAAASRFLSLVVIDLAYDEDAQEIFETLNARGTPLTPADLIKNFVFQRIQSEGADPEELYEQHWRLFETPFWEQEITVGRLIYSRSSLFLTQWLVAKTGEEITVREVFSRFKRFAMDGPGTISDLLPQIVESAKRYQSFSEGAWKQTGPLSTIEKFVYRLDIINTETAKPLLIWLTDPSRDKVPDDQLELALGALESWYVRRTIIKASSKAYNLAIAALIRELDKVGRESAGDVTLKHLTDLSGPNLYWPGDNVVRKWLQSEPLYRRMARAKVRMLLEALEDWRRGYERPRDSNPYSEQPVARYACSIEHIMPQEWRKNWPGEEFDEDGNSKDDLVHQLGNLVLVTQALNSKLSNSPWRTKKEALAEHATLLSVRDVVDKHPLDWTSGDIRERTSSQVEALLKIWPVPLGHEGIADEEPSAGSSRVSVEDLLGAGLLRSGQTLYARVADHFGKAARVSDDGAIHVEDQRFSTPSAAARHVTGGVAANGWWFWVTDLEELSSISELRDQYSDFYGNDDEGEEG